MIAVEWLVWELNKLGFFPNGVPQEIYKQAKKLEKQQIMDANVAGVNCCLYGYKNSEEYYNKTYKNDKSINAK